MPRLKRIRTNRNTYTWVLSIAILTITVFAVQRTFLLRHEQERELLDRARDELQRQVHSWREITDERIRNWLLDLPRNNPGEDEERLRDETAWFEAIYIWEMSETGPQFSHPPPVTADSPDADLSTECIILSNDLAKDDRITEATNTYEDCFEGSLQEHLILNTLLAGRLNRDAQPARTFELLRDARPDLDLPLMEAPSIDVSSRRLVTRRRHYADALEALGSTNDAARERHDLILEIAALNGPQLSQLLPLARSSREEDFDGGFDPTELETLDRELTRAHLRLEGYEQLSEYLASRLSDRSENVGPDAREVHLVQGLYADNDYVFFVMQTDVGFAAVQVESNALLDALLENLSTTPGQPATSVINTERAILRGEGFDENAPFVQISIGNLFPRLYLVRSIPAAASTSEIEWLAGQLAPVAVAVLLGIIAIMGRLRADNKERDLYERQQAFIARVTHELKTPLAGIRVMAETLEMGAAKDAETGKVFLEKIIQEAERLGKRIDEVLTVARKPEVSSRTPVAPHELAQEVVDLWTPRYQAVGARLDTDLKPCRPIAADPALLRDALNNLLDNSLKYRRVGIPGRCMVRTGEVGKHVIFEVTDNGIGVPSSMRRRIFERFARVEGAGRGKAGGHGLGLSFAAEAIEAHGGLIECIDGFNGGTRFRMKLRRG